MNRWFVLGLLVVQSACLPDKKVATPPETPTPTQVAPVAETVVSNVSKGHVAPTLADIPNDEFGESVRRGAAIFFDTPTHAAQFTGNSQSCANCHIDGGRMADSGPMWAAWGVYPAYRKKNGHVNTMEERLQGCFTYSENAQASASGAAPPKGDAVLVDLQSYIFWLAQGVAIGKEMPGRGFPKVKRPDDVSPARGAEVYAAQCSVCHGETGGGLVLEDGHRQFPPLWGPEAYNWGAGMHRLNTAAGFIKANMPLGKADLTDQQAWDVAAYINSQPRPKDPRQLATIADNKTKNHDEDCLYGEEHDGETLGTGVARAR